jgi:hypothetical protein
VEHQIVSTGAYRTDGKALIGVWLGATIKTIPLEKKGTTVEQERREREREKESRFVSGGESRMGQVRRKVVDVVSKTRS